MNIDCLNALQWYDGLIKLVEETRENFDYFESEASTKSVKSEYKIITRRRKKRLYEDCENEEVTLPLRDIILKYVLSFLFLIDYT